MASEYQPGAKRRKHSEEDVSEPADDMEQLKSEVAGLLAKRLAGLSALAALLQKHENNIKKDPWKNILSDLMKELAVRGTRLAEALTAAVRALPSLADAQAFLEDATLATKEIKKIYEWWSGYLQNNSSQSSGVFREFLSAVGGALCLAEVDACVSPIDRQINIPKQQLDSLIQVYGQESVIQSCGDLVANGALAFPAKKWSMLAPSTLFTNLQQYVPVEDTASFQLPGIRFKTGAQFFPQTFRGGFLTFVAGQRDYDQMDVITDYFQEEQRMKARRKDTKMSPMEVWASGEKSRPIWVRAIARGRDLNSYELREAIYETTKECTMFKSSLVCAVVKKLGGRRYLDISAGWGDRLVGALACQVDRYLGVDPNINLKPGHDAIIRTLGGFGAEERFGVVYAPFQTAALPDEEFDLVFTSPPYFDFEIYTTETKGQSIDEFPSFERWVVGFLLASIRKAWAKLVHGGHLAIHITDTRDANCCEIMNLYLEAKIPEAVYLGVLASRGMADRPRPIWTWQKLATLTPEQQKRKLEAEKLGQQYFPQLWAAIERDLK